MITGWDPDVIASWDDRRLATVLDVIAAQHGLPTAPDPTGSIEL